MSLTSQWVKMSEGVSGAPPCLLKAAFRPCYSDPKVSEKRIGGWGPGAMRNSPIWTLDGVGGAA